MSTTDVLVVGGGPAGSVAAYWLGKGNINVTVIERSPGNMEYGQGIDVEGAARGVIERMGVFDEMKAKGTGEQGFAMVDDDGKPCAILGQQGFSITSDIEIMRGDLCKILAAAADRLDNVTFKYGRTVTALEQTSDKVSVTFDDGTKQDFQAVVAADGFRSKTRNLFLDESMTIDAYKTFDNFVAFFDLAYEEDDFPNSRFQQCGHGRSCFVRPVNKHKSSGYLFVRGQQEKLKKALAEGRQAQKEALREIFQNDGGLFPRVIKQMMHSDNFYFEQLGQVKLPQWSQGRCAVVGDAGYAPSPLTGQGTQLGISGAYILAAELAANPKDPAAAFAEYERKFRPYVKKAQTIPLGGYSPALANPESTWGVWANRLAFRIFAATGLWKKIQARSGDEGYKLPSYPHLERIA